MGELGDLGARQMGPSQHSACPAAFLLQSFLALLLLFAAAESRGEVAAAALTSPPPAGVRFRRGTKNDELHIAATMARELMNPLSIKGDRFVVAENTKDGERMGFAQLKPLGPAVENPNLYDAPRGSGDVERNVDDELWDLFEEEDVEFPVGWKSLPWTSEYRAAAKAAEERKSRRAAMLARERTEGGQLWELSSVYVRPAFRGRGIGSELIRRVLDDHARLGRSKSDIYALTLATTLDWYRDLGFEVAEEPPAPMAFEVAAGRIVTRLIGEELVCIRGQAS